jgi:hypothetical protein
VVVVVVNIPQIVNRVMVIVVLVVVRPFVVRCQQSLLLLRLLVICRVMQLNLIWSNFLPT